MKAVLVAGAGRGAEQLLQYTYIGNIMDAETYDAKADRGYSV